MQLKAFLMSFKRDLTWQPVILVHE